MYSFLNANFISFIDYLCVACWPSWRLLRAGCVLAYDWLTISQADLKQRNMEANRIEIVVCQVVIETMGFEQSNTVSFSLWPWDVTREVCTYIQFRSIFCVSNSFFWYLTYCIYTFVDKIKYFVFIGSIVTGYAIQSHPPPPPPPRQSMPMKQGNQHQPQSRNQYNQYKDNRWKWCIPSWESFFCHYKQLGLQIPSTKSNCMHS